LYRDYIGTSGKAHSGCSSGIGDMNPNIKERELAFDQNSIAAEV